jgi:hypothetical protein
LLLATRLFNGGAGRPKPGVIAQGEGDGVAERENRRRIWGPLARITWLDDGFRRVNVQVRGNQDSRRHCRIGDFRRDGQRPVPGSTACEKEEGYEYPGAAQ